MFWSELMRGLTWVASCSPDRRRAMERAQGRAAYRTRTPLPPIPPPVGYWTKDMPLWDAELSAPADREVDR